MKNISGPRLGDVSRLEPLVLLLAALVLMLLLLTVTKCGSKSVVKELLGGLKDCSSVLTFWY